MQGCYNSSLANAESRLRKIEEQANQLNNELKWLQENINNPNIAFTPQLRAQMSGKIAKLQGDLARLQMQYSRVVDNYNRLAAECRQREYTAYMQNQQRLANQQQREYLQNLRMMYGGKHI